HVVAVDRPEARHLLRVVAVPPPGIVRIEPPDDALVLHVALQATRAEQLLGRRRGSLLVFQAPRGAEEHRRGQHGSPGDPPAHASLSRARASSQFPEARSADTVKKSSVVPDLAPWLK